jgi:hypothetical protein
MQSVLFRWLCGLSLSLGLAGCGLFGGDDASDNPQRDRTPPETPRWADGLTSRGNTSTVSLRAQTEPGSQVEFFVEDSAYVYCSGAPEQTLTADDTGSAAVQFEVEDNATTYFRAKAIDAAGNASGCSEHFTFTEDSTAPVSPRWAASMPTRSNMNAVTLSVEAVRDSRLALFGTADCSGPVLATAATGTSDRTISFPVTVADDSTNVFSVSAADELGNTSCSAAFTFVEDSTAPAPPVLTSTEPVSPSSTNTPYILGTTEPGATVLLYTAPQCPGTARKTGTADAQGRFRIDLLVEYNKANMVYARARDAVGHLSECSDALTFVSDIVEPAPPTFQRFVPPPPANNNSPVLVGTSEPGTKVLIYSGNSCAGVPVASAVTDAQGLYQATLSLVDNVTLQFSARAEDAAGNRGACWLSFVQYIEDSTPPAPPTRARLSPSSPSNGNTVTLSFSGSQDATGLLFTTADCQGTPVDSQQADPSGEIRVSVTVPDDSTTQLWLAERERAGNISGCAGPWTYVEDSAAPSGAGATVTDGSGADLSYQFTGDLAEAHWVGFSDTRGIGTYEHLLSERASCSGGAVSVASTVADTRVRLENLNLSEGAYYHCVRAKDEAGNASPWVGSNGFRVDLAPPTVVSTTPPANASAVELTAPIRFTFSEPVDAATVTASTLTVSIHGAPVAGTVACDGAATCAFTPSGPLPYREPVEVRLSTGVKDLSGRALASTHALSFTTRGRVWSPEPLLVHTARPGVTPDVAMDGQGRALAVWSQSVGSGFRPYAASYLPYVGWSAPVDLDTVRPGNAEQLAVAMNSSGRAVAVWVLRDGAQANLYAAEYTPGGGWSAPQGLESRAEAVSGPRVAVDSSGHALVVWRQSDGAAESAWVARLQVGVGWSAPLLLESGAGAVTAPVLAAVSSGQALVAWTQPDAGGTARVRASRFEPDTGWTVPDQLAETATEATVAAALSLDGSAVLVFRGPMGPPPSVSAFAARYVPGTGWSAAVELGAALASTEEPSVAMDPWGRALAAWTGPGSTSPQELQVRRYSPNGGWVRLALETDTSGQPTVAADGQGNFHLLWVENTSGIDRVMQVRYPEGSIALGTPQPLEPQHSGTSKRPRAVANMAGSAAAVWYRDNGTGFSGNLIYGSLYQ